MRVLVIDDSETQQAEIRAALSGSNLVTDVLEARDGVRGLKLLLAEPVDLVLCDLDLPGIDGEKLFRMRNTRSESSNTPFLFITASTDIDRRARLLEDGACDAITKPFHPADLLARVHLHLKVKRLQDELLEKNATLARLSTYDSLTELRSRRFVMDSLAVEFLRARRYRTPLAVVMADLDEFKAVNDRYGHPGGDAVLAGAASLLLSDLRATDLAGRYGGEEFLILMPQNDVEGSTVMAERWRGRVAAARFETPDGRRARVTVSAGIAAFDRAFETPYDLVAAADAALYRAKKNGRNRVEVASA